MQTGPQWEFNAADVQLTHYPINAANEFNARSWSLKALQQQEDVLREVRIASALRAVCREQNVKTACSPQFCLWSARVLQPSDLKRRIKLWRDAVLIKNEQPQYLSGVHLHRGTAFFYNPTGNPLIVAKSSRWVIVASGGCGGLVPIAAVRGGKRTARTRGIVEVLVGEFARRGLKPRQMELSMYFPGCGVPYHLDDEQHGAYYRALTALAQEQWPGSVEVKGDTARFRPEVIFTSKAAAAGVLNFTLEAPALARPSSELVVLTRS